MADEFWGGDGGVRSRGGKSTSKATSESTPEATPTIVHQSACQKTAPLKSKCGTRQLAGAYERNRVESMS